jgi:alkyl hydroperoxide reductase subunit AhpC
MARALEQKSLLLGDIAPDFEENTTQGKISFYQWLGNDWGILFSHPKDFTPVCTTEIGVASKLKSEFDKRKVKIIGLSVGSVESHQKWISDINETQHTKVNFPLIGDENHQVAELYGMIHPAQSEVSTVRAVFIIDPTKKIRLMIAYPQATGRNFHEILRVVDGLQLTDHYSVATPANWQWGEDCVILASLTDPEILKQKFPKGWKELKPYLRMVPQPGKD